jgi:hypothetical protein
MPLANPILSTTKLKQNFNTFKTTHILHSHVFPKMPNFSFFYVSVPFTDLVVNQVITCNRDVRIPFFIKPNKIAHKLKIEYTYSHRIKVSEFVGIK